MDGGGKELTGRMRELVNRFAQVRADLLGTVKGFSPDRVGETMFGEWDLKRVLAHMAGWDSYFTEIVRLLKAGEEPSYWGSIDEFNQASVQKRESDTWDKVNEEFVRAGAEFIVEYGNLEDGLWNQRFWEEGNPTPAWIAEINIEHYTEHLEEIREHAIPMD